MDDLERVERLLRRLEAESDRKLRRIDRIDWWMKAALWFLALASLVGPLVVQRLRS